MAKLWQRPLNPDIKTYSRYFGRGLLILAAVLVVTGLVLGTFFYGDRQRQSQQADQQPTTESADEVQVANPEPAETTTPGVSETPAVSPDNEPSDSIPAGGPSQVPVTGAEDWILPITIGLALLVYQYRRSQKQLALAREQV